MNNNDEASLKDIILTLLDYANELKKYFVILLSVLIISSLMGYFYATSKEVKYEASLSFIVNENNGYPSSTASVLSNRFGDIVEGSSSVNQHNIIAILQSKELIISTLLNIKDSIHGEYDLLFNHFIKINHLVKDNSLDIKNIRLEDSTLNIISNLINHQLKVSSQNESKVFNVTYLSKNPEFAISFVESLVEQMTRMYSSWQTEKPRYHLDYVSQDLDSIKKELLRAKEDYADKKNQNIRGTTNAVALNEIRSFLKMEDLIRSQDMLLKEERHAKQILLYKKPIIRIIDWPRHPLKKIQRSIISWTITFSAIGFIFVSCIIILRKLIRDTLLKEN